MEVPANPEGMCGSKKKSKEAAPPSAHLLVKQVKVDVQAALRLTAKDLPLSKTPDTRGMRLSHLHHFSCDAITMARQLLGAKMVRIVNGKRLSGKIVECEAYLGVDDAAAHSFRGKRGIKNER